MGFLFSRLLYLCLFMLRTILENSISRWFLLLVSRLQMFLGKDLNLSSIACFSMDSRSLLRLIEMESFCFETCILSFWGEL